MTNKPSKKPSVRLSKHIIPTRYTLLLKPYLDSFTFHGEETIELTIGKPTNIITLHAAEIEIYEVSFGQDKALIHGKSFSYDEKAETVTLSFPKQIKKGKAQLHLKFRGVLNDKMRGFYKSRYIANNKEQFMATTQFEATDARRAFPCFDEPDKKAIFDITLTIPSRLVAVSNTIESEIVEHEAGYKVVTFEPTPKMSTYLVAFIVGEFEHIEGKTKKGVVVRVFVTPGKKDQAKFALDVAIKTLEFYDDYFDIPYPLAVLDLIAIPDFASGAMENWGAITYRETAILVDDKLSSTANKQWVALVIAHEIAHQWFGNLATMQWWTHLWLNEGFASYIEYLAVDKLFPKWDIWTQFVYLDHSTALKLDGLKNTHPIEIEVKDPNEISEIFDAVSYSKGASVIRMLAEYLGEEDFRKGLILYLKKFSYKNATTADLWKCFEKVSKKPIENIMKIWTKESGYPVLYVTEKKNSLLLSQSRFFSSAISKKEEKDTAVVWPIPISIKSNDSEEIWQLMDDKNYEILRKKEEFPKLNNSEKSLVRVCYPSEYLEGFRKGITQKKLSSEDRFGLVRDVFDLAQAGEFETAQSLKFATHYKDDESYIVWAEIISQLTILKNLFSEEVFYDSYMAYCRKLLTSISLKVGWNEKKNELHTQTLLRSLVLYFLGSCGQKNTISKALQLFKDFKSHTISLDANLRSVVYSLVAQNDLKNDYKYFKKKYKEEALQEEKDRYIRALCMFKSKSLLKDILQFSLSSDVRAQDAFKIVHFVGSNQAGRELAWEFVKENWPTILKRFGGGHLLPRFIKFASDFSTLEKAREVEDFFKKNDGSSAKRTIAQVIEQIESNASWLSKDRETLKGFFSS